ncbi:ATP-dependent helicase HrpB [Thermomonospora catenispora]|uniref:ATP-dependent helicase HrpB n=1 Tax=Thermomonospora catenispora TaxID=2493090 RepID=UPI00112463D4|nr:ATP-dependent helicase HrpB [Thermomonospora catenispora]TNY37071.1 ATP-dependent helicase HrpB [Thermomonospora catenispora]
MLTDRTDLPVRPVIPALHAALAQAGTAVLAAPPGTGKTTLVPLALAGALPEVPGGPREPRRVLVVEPRRPAVRAAARRMAWLLGERVGERVGFAVRGEHRPGTLIEVVTTGVLLRRLHEDPELAGVDAVLLDECHERHLEADTALAFLLDVRAALRPDLHLVAASATVDAEPWAELLKGPVVESSAEMHPVEIVWAPPSRPIPPPHGMRVDPAFLAHVAATVRRALTEHDGDVLCFLPGVGEIAHVAALLDDIGPVADLLEVHGRAAPAVQDAVLSPGARRRVVLATAVAETSLTVPGVRIVVDSGLAREPRTDHARGLSGLTTVRASRAVADQRAGRAGRQGPGVVYRCWTAAEHQRLPERPRPEIELADLTAFALQIACWGDPDAEGLALLDPPPRAALRAARETLRAVGAVDRDGRATDRGRRMARLGVHPRLARALLDGAAAVGERVAAEVVALLSEPPPGGVGDDLAAALRTVRSGRRDPAHADRWRRETRRLLRTLPDAPGRPGEPDDAAVGTVVALAFPERVARARGGRRYLMASGTGAELAEDSPLAPSAPRWLAIAAADRPAGSPSARIRQAVPIDEEIARLAAAPLLDETEEVRWRDGDLVARRVERLGAIELASVPLADPDPALVAEALRTGLRRTGPSLLTWTAEATALRDRMAFCRRVFGDPWPEVSDEALLEAVIDGWSGGLRGRADLERLDMTAVLRGLLPWECAARLDELAPERITVPSGSRIRVDYRGDQPVLAVKLQEVFGWRAAPRLADGRVPLVLHLLSPAGRPAAVTADLASFWRNGYHAVRAELRGRYPRHPWPEDPLTARPTRRAGPRR